MARVSEGVTRPQSEWFFTTGVSFRRDDEDYRVGSGLHCDRFSRSSSIYLTSCILGLNENTSEDVFRNGVITVLSSPIVTYLH